MNNGPRGTQNLNQAQVSGPPISAVSPPQTGLTPGALGNLYLPYPNIPHPFWFGQLPIYNPPFPLPYPQQYMPVPMTSIPPVPPANYPLISEWLAFCDNYPQRSGEDFSNLASKFALEGFSRLHQLISDCITLEKLSEWFSIRKGMADLILRYAEEDVQSLKKLSQCFAILERLTWNKSSKFSNIMKIIYVILHHLSF